MRICPFPNAWHEAHQRLEWEAALRECTPAFPPRPVILGAWPGTNDVEKMERWEETVAWAERNGCRRVVDDIPDEEFYFVSEPWGGSVNFHGGPIFLPWNWTPRQRPSEREVRQSMQRLVADWHSIVGNELGEITRPLRLTGRKKRRLVVLAIASGSPPWGTWSERWYGRKDTFSRFRAAINDVLAPHQVDHIDFVTADRLE